jgi:hypothetical protein
MFARKFSNRFNIHRTRKNFPISGGVDTFANMAQNGIRIVDQVVGDEIGGFVSEHDDIWHIPR